MGGTSPKGTNCSAQGGKAERRSCCVNQRATKTSFSELSSCKLGPKRTSRESEVRLVRLRTRGPMRPSVCVSAAGAPSCPHHAVPVMWPRRLQFVYRDGFLTNSTSIFSRALSQNERRLRYYLATTSSCPRFRREFLQFQLGLGLQSSLWIPRHGAIKYARLKRRPSDMSAADQCFRLAKLSPNRSKGLVLPIFLAFAAEKQQCSSRRPEWRDPTRGWCRSRTAPHRC